jgi:hypothetical protein
MLAGVICIAAGFAYHAAWQPMDFRVYHYGTRGFFDGTRPMYGESSGLGWPLHYRYPPLFMLLFAPFALVPIAVSAAIWVVLKILVLLWLVHAVTLRMRSTDPSDEWLVPLLLAGAYVVEDFRYGNAQFFIVALVCCGLLLARERPLISGASLALGIAVKAWPLFFLPYLAVRRDWRAVGWIVVFVPVFTLLPSVWLGVPATITLLEEWFTQEFSTQLGESEIWFPNQSLRGVLMRYLTVIDYSRLPDSNYPLVHFLDIGAQTVRTIWFVVGGALYLGLLALAHFRRETEGLVEHGLAFCLLALLEPFTQKYALVVLIWPALVAGRLVRIPTVRLLIFLAAVLVLVQPLAPGSAAQRLLQVIGLDFAATAVMALSLAYASVKLSGHSSAIVERRTI